MSAVAVPVWAESARASLGGRWATSFTLWAVLLVPAIALSSYQDFGEPYANVLVAALSAVAPCTAAAIVFLVAGLLRRSIATIPIALCVLFWVGVGVVHGVTAALMDTALSRTEPHFLAQVIYWAGSCLIWLPLVTYGISQSAYRRGLLVSLQLQARKDSVLRRSSLLEIADLHALIVNAIQNNIRPVVVEIEHSLESLGPALDSARLSELGTQLAGVSEEATRIIETTSAAQPLVPESIAPEPSAPVGAALDFDQTRPLLAAVLSSVALLPLIVAVGFDDAAVDADGLTSAVGIFVVVTFLLFAGLASQRFVRHLRRTTRIVTALATYALAGVAASVVAIVGPWQPANQQNLALGLLLPIAVPLAAITLSAAVGLGKANLDVVERIAEIEAGIDQFEESLESDRRDIRAQVTALTHGPLRGRLAACAMALNFHASEVGASTPERTEFIVAGVREHLAGVLEELDSLGD